MTYKEYSLQLYDSKYWTLQIRVLFHFLKFFFMNRKKKRRLLEEKLEKAEKVYGVNFTAKSLPRALYELQEEHVDLYGYEPGIMQLEEGEKNGTTN